MIRIATLLMALAAVMCLSNSAWTQAGQLDCGCSQAPGHHAPMVYAEPAMDPCCECAAAVQSCCGVGGVGGRMVQLGSLYGSAEIYGGAHPGGFGHGHVGGYDRSPDPRSFESGFENLPNMDGGGVHHRLPFHSYRRPWAHPGVADNNINIIW